MNVTVASIEIKIQKDIANPSTEDDVLVNMRGNREALITAFMILYLKHQEFKEIINEAGRRANAQRAQEGN